MNMESQHKQKELHKESILNQVNESRRPVFVTQNGEAKAVIMDAESYQNLQNALGVLKLLAQGEKDILEGRLAFIVPVITSTEGLCVATTKCIPIALAF